jgi:hypothetical protein
MAVAVLPQLNLRKFPAPDQEQGAEILACTGQILAQASAQTSAQTSAVMEFEWLGWPAARCLMASQLCAED